MFFAKAAKKVIYYYDETFDMMTSSSKCLQIQKIQGETNLKLLVRKILCL